MTSQYWDAGQAYAYHEFQYRIPEKALAGRTVFVAGGLGAATVALPPPEGAHLLVAYRADRELAEGLRHLIESTYGRSISLVAGDIASAENRAAYLPTARKFGALLAGVAIFPSDPARMAFANLNSETLLASVESNWVGRIRLVKELGSAMESSAEDGSCISGQDIAVDGGYVASRPLRSRDAAAW
jgi:NAD(P)-dependent dehydrogenase (short-subunit alcohol dehydrogenase family)